MTPVPEIPSFSVDVVAAPGARRATVRVSGEVDIATVDELGGVVRDELRVGPVLVDLGGVTFMDSSGVRMLDALLREVSAEGWDLAFAPAMGETVVQVLEITGMMEAMPIYRDVEEAG